MSQAKDWTPSVKVTGSSSVTRHRDGSPSMGCAGGDGGYNYVACGLGEEGSKPWEAGDGRVYCELDGAADRRACTSNQYFHFMGSKRGSQDQPGEEGV